MKGKKFYLLLFGLLLVGIGSVYLYQQQEEARFLQFEGYEISAIEGQVEALYNEEKTDLAKDITEEELERLDAIFIDLSDADLSNRSRDRITRTQVDFLMAREMFFIEEDVNNLFEEKGIIKENLTLDKVGSIEKEIEAYEIKPVYYDRNIQLLDEARQQVIANESAQSFVEALYDEDGNIREDVTRDEEAEALELINDIKNKRLKQELFGQMEVVTQALEEREEALALELEAELEEEEAEEETTETVEEEETEDTSPANNRRPSSTTDQASPPRTPNRTPTPTPNRTPASSGTSNNNQSGTPNPAPNPPSNGGGSTEGTNDNLPSDESVEEEESGADEPDDSEENETPTTPPEPPIEDENEDNESDGNGN